MRIAVIQASTRTDINQLLFEAVKKAAGKDNDIINLGIFPEETESYSYVEVAVMISLLIETGSIDFVITGCSSGQGMMMACNSLPGLRAGFIQTPQDAFLFGRINNGNVASLALGLNFGWAGELNLQYTLDKLFEGDFGTGYPLEVADRKRQESEDVIYINRLTKRSFIEIFDKFDKIMINKILSREVFYQYLKAQSKNQTLFSKLLSVKS
ncbi:MULTISPECIES: RpiB/LacA/LacB family sugar-phosphate isomerase [Streptococcus]|uniref:RpiB/LacA/LacB family sugar-phosphate isomerase n=1 Tax=Streptococcus caledonicus TaxID=2614158 RepID=A0ABW0UD63_9STRE|nr:RpiB/LacA/LacB family sugar-phosphate isomerase [Streptococcus sp. S784/96/1]